jgi:hypothetical protein
MRWYTRVVRTAAFFDDRLARPVPSDRRGAASLHRRRRTAESLTDEAIKQATARSADRGFRSHGLRGRADRSPLVVGDSGTTAATPCLGRTPPKDALKIPEVGVARVPRISRVSEIAFDFP